MKILSRLLYADNSRKTRLHTGNGYLCLHPIEIGRSVVSTVARHTVRSYSESPWLVYSAISHIASSVKGKRVFEFGSGMSTIWFAGRCQLVVSVESSLEWFNRVQDDTADMENVRLIYAESENEYVQALAKTGDKFDLVLVDGLSRTECIRQVRPYVNRGGLVVVDNTDVDPELAEAVATVFSDSRIRRFRGWAPGILHPNETTVIEDIP